MIELLILFATMQVADIVTTYLVISRNKGYEANPIMRQFIVRLGVLPGLLLPKVAVIGLVVWLVSDGMAYMDYVLAISSAGYLWVVISNYKIAVK